MLLRVQENDTLGSTFGDILVLTLLRVGKTVVLIEEVTGVDAVGFLASGLDDTDTTTGDITETQMETTRLGTDDQKHAIQGSRVLSLGEEGGVETETQSNLGGGEVVGLEDGIVENAESSEDHFLVLVSNSLSDAVLELVVGENLDLGSGSEESAVVVGANAQVDVGERGVQRADETRVVLDDFEDVVRSEGLSTETALELGQELGLATVVDIEDLGQRNVLGTKTVEEVLDKDPGRVGIDSLLKAQLTKSKEVVELVLGQAVQERDFLGDLVDGLLHGREVAVLGRGRAKIDGHDADAVGELLDVLSGRGDTIVMVKIGEGREHATGGAAAETDNETLLVGVLNVEDLNDGTSSADSKLNDLLVDLLGVLSSLLQETNIRDLEDVSLLGIRLLNALRELALVDEVATERGLGGRASSHDSGRTESLDTVLAAAGVVEVLVLKTAFVAGTLDVGLTRLAGVNVDGVVLSLHVKADLLALVLTGESGDLGGVEGGDLSGNNFRALNAEVDIIDAELLVEPVNLLINESLRNPAGLSDNGPDSLLLVSSTSELRSYVANGG